MSQAKAFFVEWQKQLHQVLFQLYNSKTPEKEVCDHLATVVKLVDDGRRYVMFTANFENNSSKFIKAFNAQLSSRSPVVVKSVTDTVIHLAAVLREGFKAVSRALLTEVIHMASYVGDQTVAEHGKQCMLQLMTHCPSGKALKNCANTYRMSKSNDAKLVCVDGMRVAVLHWPINKLTPQFKVIMDCVNSGLGSDDKEVQLHCAACYYALLERAPELEAELNTKCGTHQAKLDELRSDAEKLNEASERNLAAQEKILLHNDEEVVRQAEKDSKDKEKDKSKEDEKADQSSDSDDDDAQAQRIQELEARLASMEQMMRSMTKVSMINAHRAQSMQLYEVPDAKADDEDDDDDDEEDSKAAPSLSSATTAVSSATTESAVTAEPSSSKKSKAGSKLVSVSEASADAAGKKKKQKKKKKKKKQKNTEEKEKGKGKKGKGKGAALTPKAWLRAFPKRVRELVEQIETIDPESWKERVATLGKLVQLCKDGMQYDGFAKKMDKSHKPLTNGINSMVTDLRGEVIRHTAACIIDMVMVLGITMKRTARGILPTLVQIASVPNAVTRRVMLPCVQAVVEYAPSVTSLKFLVKTQSKTKSKFGQLCCLTGVLAAIEHWPLRGKFKDEVKTIKKSVVAGLSAASPEARAVALVAFWALVDKLPELEHNWLETLNKRARKQLNKHKPEHLKQRDAAAADSDDDDDDEEEEKRAKKPARRTKTNVGKSFMKEWPRQLEGILDILEQNGKNWSNRIEALQELEQLVKDGVGFSRKFGKKFAKKLNYISKALVVQLSDSRADVVKAVCTCVSGCVTALKTNFKDCILELLPSLITVAASPNKIIRGFGDPCLLTCMEECPSRTALQVIVNMLEGSKARLVNVVCVDALSVAVEKWPLKEKILPELRMVALGIAAGLKATHVEARALAVKAYWTLHARNTDIEAELDGMLSEQRHKDMLERGKPGGDAGDDDVEKSQKKKHKARRAARRSQMKEWIKQQKSGAGSDVSAVSKEPVLVTV